MNEGASTEIMPQIPAISDRVGESRQLQTIDKTVRTGDCALPVSIQYFALRFRCCC